MANVIQALMTNGGRQALAKSFGGPSGGFAYSYGKYFKIGTGAWQNGVQGREPVTPSATQTDIQSVTSGIFWYRKTFQVSDLLFVSSFTMQFRCFLDLANANGDSGIEPDTLDTVDGPKHSAALSGNTPIFFELGVFDNADVLVAYGTFPGETKLVTKTLNHLVNVNF